MRSDNIGLFDMDGSLADYERQLVEDLEKLRAPEEPPIGNVWEAENKLPHLRARMNLIKAQPGWWFNLPEIGAGMQILREAMRIGFDCHILTKGPKKHPYAWAEKVQWVQHHIGDLQIHVTSDKGLVYGKFLYDDFPEYILRWLEHRPRGLAIMPVTAYNKHLVHPQIIQWNGENLEEVVKALELVKNRNSGEPLNL